jgi:hypothetical protein
MSKILRFTALLTCLCVPAALCAAAAAAAPTPQTPNASVKRVVVDGFAYALFGDCDVPVPADGSVCHETEVIAFREARAVNGGSVAPPHTPWTLVVTHITTTWDGGEYTIVDFAFGSSTDVVVEFDHAQLGFLEAVGRVTLDDGSTADVAVAWVAWSPVEVFGSDGPTNIEDGLRRHYVDRCVTLNANAHQKFRFAAMSGTVNGSDVRSYSSFEGAAFIARNHFVYVAADHGGAC